MGPFERLRGWIDGGEPGSGGHVTDGGTDPAARADLGPREFRRRADETAESWPDLDLDFTLPSLERLDGFAAEREDVFENPLDPDDGRPPMAGGEYLLDFGSYCGEVLAGNFDGDWVDEEGWAVAVPVAEGTATVGVFDVAARSFVQEPAFAQAVETLEAGRAGSVGAPGVAAGASRELGARAAALVDDRGWELNYSAESLLRLDDLVDGGEEGPGRASEDGLDEDSADDLPDGLGAYLGEVFVRRYAGEWCWSEAAGWVVDVEGPAGRRTLDVRGVLQDRLADATTFAAAHDDLLAATGVDGPELAVIALAGRYREAAEALADDHDGLDFSVPSLARLDRLADGLAPDDEVDLLEVEPGAAEDPVERLGGYFAEVFRRNHVAAWRLGGGGDGGDGELVVRGDGPTAELSPGRVAEAALAGEATFVRVYARLAERIGLNPPVDA